MMEARQFELKDGRQLEVRPAEADDAADLLAFLEQISSETDFVSFGPGEFGKTPAEEAEFIRQCQAADNELLLLGLLGGEIVASCIFAGGKRSRTRHAGELGMSVCKRCWNLGVGSCLLDTLIDWARKSGVVTKLNLRVRTDNHRAIALYQRKGFIVEGTIRRDFLIAGQYFDHFWMGLES
jgi:RimJ/RimL family protein N-acetyltransferase